MGGTESVQKKYCSKDQMMEDKIAELYRIIYAKHHQREIDLKKLSHLDNIEEQMNNLELQLDHQRLQHHREVQSLTAEAELRFTTITKLTEKLQTLTDKMEYDLGLDILF